MTAAPTPPKPGPDSVPGSVHTPERPPLPPRPAVVPPPPPEIPATLAARLFAVPMDTSLPDVDTDVAEPAVDTDTAEPEPFVETDAPAEPETVVDADVAEPELLVAPEAVEEPDAGPTASVADAEDVYAAFADLEPGEAFADAVEVAPETAAPRDDVDPATTVLPTVDGIDATDTPTTVLPAVDGTDTPTTVLETVEPEPEPEPEPAPEPDAPTTVLHAVDDGEDLPHPDDVVDTDDDPLALLLAGEAVDEDQDEFAEVFEAEAEAEPDVDAAAPATAPADVETDTDLPTIAVEQPDAVTPALRLRGLVKSFGGTRAVDGIDLEIPAGTFYGIVGPNGAGKTTTLSMIAGLLAPDEGAIEVAGVDLRRDQPAAKALMGVLPDRLHTFDRLTGRQLLHYYGMLRGLPPAVVAERAEDLATAFAFTDALGRPVSDYSVGMTKKVMLAGAMIHAPRLLVLDEPFEAVDPVSSARILDILSAYVARGGTVVLSSHGMELVERVCTGVAVIVAGRVLAEGTVDEVRAGATLGERYVEIVGGLGDVEGLEWLHSFSD